MKKKYFFLLTLFVVVSLNAQSGTEKFVWLKGEYLGATYQINAFSDNNEFAVGRVMQRAFIYNVKQNKVTYLTDEDELSEAYDVSDNGVVVGVYGDSNFGSPCYWDKDGNLTMLADFMGGSFARGISPSGDIIVGNKVNGQDDPNPFSSTPYCWTLEADNKYKMRQLQVLSKEEFGGDYSGTSVIGIGANGTILAFLQEDRGAVPVVYYKSYTDKPVYFAKDSMMTFNEETWEFEGPQPFMSCSSDAISQDGKWISCAVSKPLVDNDRQFEIFYSSAYNIEEDKFYTNDKILSKERAAVGNSIDNNGNILATVMAEDAMVGRYIVYIKKGEMGSVLFTDYISELGVDTAPFEEVESNTLMTVSGDGKMITGFSLTEEGMIGWLFDADGTLSTPDLPSSILSVGHNVGLNCYVTSDNFLRLNSDVKEVTVFNVSGQQILSVKATGKDIDLNSLTSGIYMVKLVADNTTFTSKIVVR